MAPRVVAIHQPNFLPWLGYFDKIARSDVFVLLDDVQFPKKGGTWVNRVRLLVNGEPLWATIPVVRGYHGTRTIREMEINESKPWRKTLLRTVEHAYGPASASSDAGRLVTELVGNPTSDLASYNLAAIRELSERLGLEAELVLASELGVPGTATDRLVQLVGAVDGDAYLAGGGAGGYQEDAKFAKAGIELVEQGFEHPPYPQRGPEFVPGLSIVDALMNLGVDGTAALVRGG